MSGVRIKDPLDGKPIKFGTCKVRMGGLSTDRCRIGTTLVRLSFTMVVPMLKVLLTRNNPLQGSFPYRNSVEDSSWRVNNLFYGHHHSTCCHTALSDLK